MYTVFFKWKEIYEEKIQPNVQVWLHRKQTNIYHSTWAGSCE